MMSGRLRCKCDGRAVASEDVRAQLRDERLQALIAEVDGARDREKVHEPVTLPALDTIVPA